MAANRAAPVRPSLRLTQNDGDGNRIHNQILIDLPQKEREVLFPKLEFVRLMVHQILHEPGDTLKSVYFCNGGLISVLTVFSDGKSVEVGLIGKEGLVGLPLIAGFRTSATRTIVQIEATAFRIDGEKLLDLLPQCPTLERRLHQASQIMTMEVTQIAACNRLHEVDERLARWLLMTQDRVGSGMLPITHDFVATMMGTDRSSVSLAASVLQKHEIIEYVRGAVKIVNRRKLEKSACECYAVIRQFEHELGLQ